MLYLKLAQDDNLHPYPVAIMFDFMGTREITSADPIDLTVS